MALVQFSHVSKLFRHSGAKLLRAVVREHFRARETGAFYALKDVSFKLERGESMALIGRNGAGKSTLLSLVAGLSRPSSGSVTVNGRVAALLELGSGFHPDLTGCENVRLNAALLGLSRKRTQAVFEEIVNFAEIGDFIRDPLRTYSTGMVLRLAFSVAVHVDPDILIIDEVLAVGDQRFQSKCFECIADFREQGKTLLFVSHSAPLVQRFCDRAIWLEKGGIAMCGAPSEVLKAYSEVPNS